MKILFVSDLHGNAEALEVLPDDFDVLVCAGDMVDYGPDSRSIIDFIHQSARMAVTGNHDKAAALGIDCGCSQVMHDLSVATREHLGLDDDEKAYINSLPLSAKQEVGGVKIFMTHATPDDLYRYISPDITDEELMEMFADINADIILWGHTHLPWMRTVGDFTVLNPGSLGQPRDGNPDASYAVWDDGDLQIIRKSYNRQLTADKIRSGPLSQDHQQRLIKILYTGKT